MLRRKSGERSRGSASGRVIGTGLEDIEKIIMKKMKLICFSDEQDNYDAVCYKKISKSQRGMCW